MMLFARYNLISTLACTKIKHSIKIPIKGTANNNLIDYANFTQFEKNLYDCKVSFHLYYKH